MNKNRRRTLCRITKNIQKKEKVMISHLMSNSAFSSTINQINNKNTSLVNQAKNEQIEDRQKTSSQKASSSRVEEIKNAIKNGNYQINLKESAEKLAQELLR